MEKREKNFKILMILLVSVIFCFQIYYGVSLLINGIDMHKALEFGNLYSTYENHPSLLGSRMIIALMETHSLNVDFLSGVMVFFLVVGALNIFDVLYFGLILVELYFAIQTKKAGLIIVSVTSFFRMILFIFLVIFGGVAVLQVFLVGNHSVKDIVDLGSFVVPIIALFFLIFSILSYITYLKLEFREV